MAPKKSQRQGKSAVDAIESAVARLRGARHPIAALGALRQSLAPGAFVPLLAAIDKNPYLKRQLFHPPAPKHLRQLKQYPTLPPTSVEREVRWAGAYLRLFPALLEEFFTYAAKFRRAFLLGEIADAETALSSIESSVGVSLWLIKRRIALAQRAHGLETQKAYVAEVRAQSPRNGIAPFVAYHTSVRHEESSTPSGFARGFEHGLGTAGIPTDFEQYLRYHILQQPSMLGEHIAAILRHEHAGTVVDYYEAFLVAARVGAALGAAELRTALLSAVTSLRTRLPDNRLRVLEIELGGPSGAPLEPEAYSRVTVDLLLAGHYREAAENGLQGLRAAPDDPDLLLATARALALADDLSGLIHVGNDGQLRLVRPIGKEGALASEVLVQMMSVIAEGPRSEQVEPLLKTATSHLGEHWADIARAVITEEISNNPLARQELPTRFAVSAIPEANAWRVGSIAEREVRRTYTDLCSHELAGSVQAVFATRWLADESDLSCRGKLSELGHLERELLCAETAFAVGRWEEARKCASALADANKAFFTRRALRLECACLVRLGRIREAATRMASALAQDWTLHEVLPVAEIANALDGTLRAELAGTLAPAIVFDFYGTFVGSRHDSHLAFAFEDVLIWHGLQRPSDLRGITDKFVRHELIHFLNYVCVGAVMDRAVTMFKGSRDVVEERVAVCRLLLDLDPENAEQYQAEIRTLLGGLMVRRRLREVEESKIYVDREGVVRAVDSPIRESFRRYQALQKHGIGAVQVTQGAVDKGRVGNRVDGVVELPLPASEITALLSSMVHAIRDEFVSNSAYGLDGFLSTRIRHGTLVNQLRSGLEEVHLITPRDAATNRYLRDEYWTARLGDIDAPVEAEVARRLAEFSRQFDEFVRVVRSEWIQIRRMSADKGLFNFMIGDEHIEQLARITTIDSSYDAFVTNAMLLLDGLLDLNLSIVRQTLDVEGKRRVEDMLASLQRDLKSIPEHLDRSELLNAIASARTKVQLSIDRVIQWFHHSGAQAYEPFTLGDAVRVAEASLTTAGRSIDVRITEENEAAHALFSGRLLTHIVDVFFILLDNVLTHDHLGATRTVVVKVWRDERFLRARVQNSVGRDVWTPEAERRLAEIRAGLANGHYLSRSATEGGSGLYKVGKIIAHDLSQPPELRFGFEGEHAFGVELGFGTALLEPAPGAAIQE